jgi:hypothetical protein
VHLHVVSEDLPDVLPHLLDEGRVEHPVGPRDPHADARPAEPGVDQLFEVVGTAVLEEQKLLGDEAAIT